MKKILIGIFTISTLLSCTKDPVDVDLVFKLNYDNAPLEMLSEYTYPDGRKMTFTRFSFYISDISTVADGVSTLASDVELFDLSQSHDSQASAAEGFSYKIKDVDPATDMISFSIGVNEELNTKKPVDFAPEHPLAKTGEYWLAWSSYIFFKIEGTIDLDGDGVMETNLSLHMGSEHMRREGLTGSVDSSNEIVYTIDVHDIFQNSEGTYDVDNHPSIHSHHQIDQAKFIMDNFVGQLVE